MWLPRKPAWSLLTALLPEKTALTALTSQEGSNPPSSNSGNNRSQAGNKSVSSQAGRLAGNPLPQDSTASQEASMVCPNSTPSREGSALTVLSPSSQPVRNAQPPLSFHRQTALGPQVDSGVSQVKGASSQAVRHSTRLRTSQADSAIPQVDSEVSQASRASPP